MCPGEVVVVFLSRLFNQIKDTRMTPQEWRNMLVLILQNQGNKITEVWS